ncbi:MAG: hypothetical protein JNL28_12620 [Planctomycetes bacterium]|nr:hypothetical protein [Planctomycetota bacterium]
MKLTHKSLYVALALAALVTAPLAFNASHEGSQGKGENAQAEHEEGGLEAAMQTLNGCMKRFGKAFEQKDMAAVAQVSVDMQKAVLAGKTETPIKANEISDAKAKAEFILGFRKQLITLEKSLLDIELAALDGKADEARKIFEEAVKPMKKTGHAKYKD